MLHPHTKLVWVGDAIGYGVVATEPIPRGTVLWALDPLDIVLSPRAIDRLGEPFRAIVHKYGYVDGAGDTVVCWDFARFMNHSCEPSSLGPGADFEIAVRDLEPGDELTTDYGYLNLEQSFTCLCGSAACRMVIQPGDFEVLASGWDQAVQSALPEATRVLQPLAPHLDMVQLSRWSAEPASAPSVSLHRAPPARSTGSSPPRLQGRGR